MTDNIPPALAAVLIVVLGVIAVYVTWIDKDDDR